MSIFISYSFVDSKLAWKFKEELHSRDPSLSIFLAEDKDSIKLGEEWSQRIMDSIKECEYFVLLLSDTSIKSAMVAGELDLAIKMKNKGDKKFPFILPIRISLSFDVEIDYNLASKVSKYQQRLWKSKDDTAAIIDEIISIINNEDSDKDLAKEKIEIPAFEDGISPANKVKVNPHKKSNNKYYVERQVESTAISYLNDPAMLIKIKAPEQFGKGHLLNKILRQLDADECTIIPVEFSGWGGTDFESIKKFLFKFCVECYEKKNNKVADYLRIASYWNDLGDFATDKLVTASFFKGEIIGDDDKMVFLALNDIDYIFSHRTISEEFCSMIRAWYNESQTANSIFSKLRLAVTYSTDTKYAIRDINQSPFNIGGPPIIIGALSKQETAKLARLYDDKISKEHIDFLYNTFGGHPFLTKSALSKIYVDKLSIPEMKNSLLSNDSPFFDHLASLSTKIREHNLEQQIRSIINCQSINDESYFKLAAIGVIKGSFGDFGWANKLYQDFFSSSY